jgi:hypothetical protein
MKKINQEDNFFRKLFEIYSLLTIIDINIMLLTF